MRLLTVEDTKLGRLRCPWCGHVDVRFNFQVTSGTAQTWALCCPLCSATTLPVDLDRRVQFLARDFKEVRL